MASNSEVKSSTTSRSSHDSSPEQTPQQTPQQASRTAERTQGLPESKEQREEASLLVTTTSMPQLTSCYQHRNEISGKVCMYEHMYIACPGLMYKLWNGLNCMELSKKSSSHQYMPILLQSSIRRCKIN